MVETDISRLTWGALYVKRGVAGGKRKTRVVEKFQDLAVGGISC